MVLMTVKIVKTIKKRRFIFAFPCSLVMDFIPYYVLMMTYRQARLGLSEFALLISSGHTATELAFSVLYDIFNV